MRMLSLYLQLILFIMLTSSALIGSEFLSSYNVVYLALLALALPIFIKRKFDIYFKMSHLIVTFTLILLSLMSSIKNEELTLFISNLALVLIFYIGYYFYNFIYKASVYKYDEFIKVALLISLLMIWMIIKYPATNVVYRGIYENPNTMGVMLVTALILNIAIFFGLMESILNKRIILINLLVSISFPIFFHLTLTLSRTSIIAYIVTFLLTYITYSIRAIYKGRLTSILKHTLFLILIIGIVIYYLPSDLLEPIQNKFEQKSGDTLDLRGYIWATTIRDSGLLGQGSNYFDNTFILGAHNTFISLLGRYGYAYTIIILIIWIWLGIKSFLYTIKSISNIYLYFPFTTWLGVSLLSMAEVMLFKPIMLVFFLSLALLTNKDFKTTIVKI